MDQIQTHTYSHIDWSTHTHTRARTHTHTPCGQEAAAGGEEVILEAGELCVGNISSHQINHSLPPPSFFLLNDRLIIYFISLRREWNMWYASKHIYHFCHLRKSIEMYPLPCSSAGKQGYSIACRRVSSFMQNRLWKKFHEIFVRVCVRGTWTVRGCNKQQEAVISSPRLRVREGSHSPIQRENCNSSILCWVEFCLDCFYWEYECALK